MIFRILLAGFASLVLACSPGPEAESPSVSDAWIREAPPGAGMTAGYLTLSNPTEQPVELTAVRSEDFDSIEFHVTVNEDGMSRMRREERVAVPARGSVEFAPGGRHLMLFGPRRSLAEGDAVELIFTLSDGRELREQAPVRRGGPEHAHH